MTIPRGIAVKQNITASNPFERAESPKHVNTKSMVAKNTGINFTELKR